MNNSDRTGDALPVTLAIPNPSRAIKGGSTMLMLRSRFFVSVIRLAMIPTKLETRSPIYLEHTAANQFA
jgi:hypothetical protein